jgi:hypothetical protein
MGMRQLLSAVDLRGSEFWYSLHDVEAIVRSLNTVGTPSSGVPVGRAEEEAEELFQLMSYVESQRQTTPRKILGVELACSPKSIPPDMRVFRPESGQGDFHEGQEAQTGSDHRQAA